LPVLQVAKHLVKHSVAIQVEKKIFQVAMRICLLPPAIQSKVKADNEKSSFDTTLLKHFSSSNHSHYFNHHTSPFLFPLYSSLVFFVMPFSE